MKKYLWLILILVLVVAFLFLGGAEKIMVWYYANKSGQDVAQVEEYLNKAEEYQAKVKEDVNNFDYRIEMARAYEYAGNVDKAIAVYEDFSDNVGDDIFFVYHNNLAKLYEKKLNWPKAIEHYEMISQKFPNDYAGNYRNLTNAYLEAGEQEKASASYFKYRSITGQQDGALEQRLGL